MPEQSIIPTMSTFADAYAYAADAWQRSILFLEVMRQRGAQYEEHTARTAPHVLVLRGPLESADRAALHQLVLSAGQKFGTSGQKVAPRDMLVWSLTSTYGGMS
jgi:hypothetical protein